MKVFAGKHPEIAGFAGWAKTAPWTESYAEETPINGLNTFLFVDASGAEHPVRWSLKPAATVVPIKPEDLAKQGARCARDRDHGPGRQSAADMDASSRPSRTMAIRPPIRPRRGPRTAA